MLRIWNRAPICVFSGSAPQELQEPRAFLAAGLAGAAGSRDAQALLDSLAVLVSLLLWFTSPPVND